MSIPRPILEREPGLGEWCILHGYRGSIAHGMYEPNDDPHSIDDKDTMAVCVPPRDYYYGLREFGSRGTREIMEDEWDIVIYEARKMVRMLARGNPNVLSLLWLPENLYVVRTPAGQYLLDNRELFATRRAYYPFVGYAKDQLYKMTHQAYQGYMGQKRKALVKQHGYDTKNAAHLIRLLRMGIEFLRDGALNVDRGGYDAAELLAIKHGRWSLERVKEEADRLFRRAEEVADRSTLPLHPDMDRVSNLCEEIVSVALERIGG